MTAHVPMKRRVELDSSGNIEANPRAVSSLFRVYSDLTFLLRPSWADPYNTTGNGVERVVLWDDLDGLSAP